MMTDEEVLLANLLDSLDRLYDRDCGAFDVYALTFATSKALAGTDFHCHIEPFVGILRSIVQTQPTGEMRRDAALIATSELRKLLADVLPKPK